MTSTQNKVVGTILMVLGALGLIVGGIGISDVYEVNEQLKQVGGMFGGLGMDVSGMLGESEASYTRPVVFLVVSIFGLVAGFKFLGRKQK
jgi:hypothetical protein